MSSIEDDDLDAPRLRRTTSSLELSKTVDHYLAEAQELTTISADYRTPSIPGAENHEPPRKRQKSVITEPERIEWNSDGELSGGKSDVTTAASRRKGYRATRANFVAENEVSSTSGPSRRGTTGVGRSTRRKRPRRTKVYGDGSSDDDKRDLALPSYLQNRRKRFDERRDRLKEGGLQLPPTYDDVYFSDEDRLQHLKEKPDFPLANPSRPYDDIELPYSLGLIPAPIAQYLRDYQVKGAAFLHELFVYQKGGILGDDMGLGKTIQVIAFLTAAYGKTGDERDRKRMRKMRQQGKWYPRTLIICPGSLLANWRDELNRWGWWHIDMYHGSAEHKNEVISQAQSGRLEIMLTTYDTYRLSRDSINMVSWDCVIADECHKIKERTSDTTKAMNELNALCRIGLTGTAIQNRYEELWTLLNWTNPGRLGPINTWKTSVCEPLKLGQSHDASNYQLAKGRKIAKLLVHNLLPQFFLRRMKTLIKDQLPKKSDRVVFCPLTQTQSMAYQTFLESDIVDNIRNSGDLCPCGSGKKTGWCCGMLLEDGTKWQSWVFPAIATLQKLSNHLAIIVPQSSDPPQKQTKDLEMLQIAMPNDWRGLYQNRDSLLQNGNPELCGKWRVLKKLLKFWHEQGSNKVLIFSHSVRLLKMLQNLFISTSYNVKYLDGSMKYEDRYAAVEDFNADPTQFVFLISTRAGGVGLNITSANKVVVVDPNWNPSYDLQAQDRAYRIGQTRDVEVFRLVSQGTLEEIVYARQIYKQQQASIGYNASTERRYFQGVQDRKDQKGEIFGLQNLFTYQNDNVVLRDIVNKTNIAEARADVRVASLEVDDNENDNSDGEDLKEPDRSFKSEQDTEDAIMSQIVAEITDGAAEAGSSSKSGIRSSSRKHDPIQAILLSVGVSYTHENSEVIGSSKVEARLSKRAEDASEAKRNWDSQQQQSKAFGDDSQSQSQSQIEDISVLDLTGSVRYRYRPPDEVKKRQFCSMAQWAGYDNDVVSFALVVESWSQAKRRDFLDRFYKWRRMILNGETKEGDHLQAEANLGAMLKTEPESDDEDDEL